MASTTNIPDDVLQVYQRILPNPEGITFLFSTRLSEALQVTTQRVASTYQATMKDTIEELRRLLAIKAFVADKDATKISPTPLMDELWHAAILDTQLYADMQAALGLVLHHRPSGASERESEDREVRLAAMKALYTAFFLTEPLERSSPQPRRHTQRKRPRLLERTQPISIFVLNPTGKTLTVKVDGQATLDELKETIQDITDITPDSQRLIFAGKQLEDGGTLEDYGIRNGDTLHVMLRLIGC